MAETRAEHIAQLAELIKDVEVAMFTTTGVDGRLYSRPLATQQVAFNGDLWFVITADSPKVAEIALATGLSPLAHMEGGFGAWKQAGLPYTGTDMATGAPKAMNTAS